jgi:hypothetical protein
MSDHQKEHGELTDRFRAFAQSEDPEPRSTARLALIGGGVIVAVIALVVVWALLS